MTLSMALSILGLRFVPLNYLLPSCPHQIPCPSPFVLLLVLGTQAVLTHVYVLSLFPQPGVLVYAFLHLRNLLVLHISAEMPSLLGRQNHVLMPHPHWSSLIKSLLSLSLHTSFALLFLALIPNSDLHNLCFCTSLPLESVRPLGLGVLSTSFWHIPQRRETLPDTQSVFNDHMGQWSESKAIPGPVGSTLSSPPSISLWSVFLKGRLGVADLVGKQHTESSQMGSKVGLTWSLEVRGCWCVDFSVIQTLLEERTTQMSTHVRQNAAFAESRNYH